MRKIDAFAHILPRPYLDRLEKHLDSSLDRERLRYYQAGVFGFDETLTDLAEVEVAEEPAAETTEEK